MAEETPQVLYDGQNSYIYGPNGLPIEQINSEGKALYLHHDQQGSTRLLTGSTGIMEGAMTYDPYGNLLASSGTKTTPMGYDGQYTNSDTGLIYLRAREYDPATDQFLSVDPIEAITEAPYSYTYDDPLNGIDPSGLSGCGSTFIISTVCNSLEESEVSNAAAEALNVITFGVSTELAGEAFGFNSECANFGTGGKVGAATAFGVSLFDGEAEAELAAEGAAEASTDAMDLTFGHGARHLAETALDSGDVESAIRAQIKQSVTNASATGSFWGRTVVDGQTVEYRAYTLPNGTINVGTYYVVP